MALVLAANPHRVSCWIRNDGPAVVYLGPRGVTPETGLALEPGASLTDETTTEAWQAVPAPARLSVREIT